MARLPLPFVALVPFLVAGIAPVSGDGLAAPDPALSAPGEDCVPAGSQAPAVLAAARAGQGVRVGAVEVPPLRASSDFPWREAEPEAGRPHDMAGPIHFFRQKSLEPGSTTVAGYVRCDFVYGVVNHAGGPQVEFGERPTPRPDGPAPLADDAPPAPEQETPPLDEVPFQSIDVLKHIYYDEGVDGPEEAMDPVNVVFYDTIRPTLGQMLSGAGYKNTPDWCMNQHIHPTHFWDGMHGGATRWQNQDDEWGTDWQDWTCYHGSRHHVRLYESVGGDTHNPGFRGYILAPVHMDESPQGPEDGQNELWIRLANNGHFTVPPNTVIVSTGSTEECLANVGNCGPPKWKGEVDLYEAGSNDPDNPEEGPQCGSVRASTFVGTWQKDPNDRFPGLRLECLTASFDATFTQVRGNQYWIQANVATNSYAVRQVHVSINGGSWLPLTKQTWGATAWGASYTFPQGATVQLRATDAAAWSPHRDVSSCYRWIPPTNTDASVVPCSYPFDATFTNPNGNEWWVAVSVAGNKALSGVDARVNCGTWVPLVKQSWGEWAKSFNVPAGAKVDFQARATTGEVDRSGGYVWPTATPTTACP